MHASAVVDLRDTFGATFIGLIFSTTLFGLTLAQTWIYFWRFGSKDPKGLKIFIALIAVLETFHTILTAYMVYWYIVLNFGNVENLGYSMWASDVQANISMVYTSAIHFYYARRIYIVSKSIIFPAIIVGSVVSGNILAIVSAAKQAGIAQVSKRFQSTAWLSEVGMCIAVLMDITIAAIMSRSLYRKKTGFARTDSIIMTLMAYTVNTGLVSSMLGIAMFVSFRVASSSLVWLAFFWAVAKFYVNSLLAMLNSREYVRGWSNLDNTDNAYNPSSIRIDARSGANGPKSREIGVSVTVHRSTALDFTQNKSDQRPTLEVPNPTRPPFLLHAPCQSHSSGS